MLERVLNMILQTGLSGRLMLIAFLSATVLIACRAKPQLSAWLCLVGLQFGLVSSLFNYWDSFNVMGHGSSKRYYMSLAYGNTQGLLIPLVVTLAFAAPPFVILAAQNRLHCLSHYKWAFSATAVVVFDLLLGFCIAMEVLPWIP